MVSYSLSHRVVIVHNELMWTVIVYRTRLLLYIMNLCGLIVYHSGAVTVHYILMWTIIYNYNILERVIVENIISRYVIIEVQPRLIIIFRGMTFSTISLSRMLNLFYYTEHYSLIFSTLFSLIMVLEVPKTAQCTFAKNR